MSNPTPKRIAASIVAADIEIVSSYWRERYPEMDPDLQDEVQKYLDQFCNPLEDRCRRIAKDIRAWNLS